MSTSAPPGPRPDAWTGPTASPGPRAVGIGELLWDLLPGGPRLGGAPFNVVAHLRRLGFSAAYVSSVGDDDLGRRALAEMRRLGVATGFVGIADRPTGTARVELAAGGLPTFEIVSPAAYETLTLPEPDAALDTCDVLVFGTLAQRFLTVHATTRQLARNRRAALRLYDANLREGCWDPELVDTLIRLATVLKVNEEEARVLGRALSLPAESIEAFAAAATARYGLRGVCITCGADGAALQLDGRYAEVQALPVTVADTVGAGDAFSAGLAAGIVAGMPVEPTLELASRLAAIVASREGAIPDWEPGELGGSWPGRPG